MNKTLEALTLITQILTTANIGVPIVFGVVASVAALIKGITGEPGPTLGEQATMIEAQLDANDPKIRAEIARMKAVLGLPA